MVSDVQLHFNSLLIDHFLPGIDSNSEGQRTSVVEEPYAPANIGSYYSMSLEDGSDDPFLHPQSSNPRAMSSDT